MTITQALEQSQPDLVRRLTAAIREQQLNQRAEQTYLHWITRFVLFHDSKDPEALENEDQQQFLSYLSEGMRVSRARLNQARQALTFFYEKVLGKSEMSGVAAA
ncbi:site-specific integrase [Marinobacter sp. DUT-1]|uniref:site-specific integrase n=1 Tax=Marinobacter sp. DUT-1 TaxID=3412037 RepID=UPI003D186A26